MISRWLEPSSQLFESVYATPNKSPFEKRRVQFNWKELYRELATLSVSRMEPKPLYGRNASRLTPGFAWSVPAGGWLMSASRWRCSPRRPTYATDSTVLQGICLSTVTFQFQASGFLKALLCVVTTRGTAFVEVPPGLSTLPKDTLALGWKGGLPPRKIESLTPSRVKKRPMPARTTVF